LFALLFAILGYLSQLNARDDLLTPLRRKLVGIWQVRTQSWRIEPGKIEFGWVVSHCAIRIEPIGGKLLLRFDLSNSDVFKDQKIEITTTAFSFDGANRKLVYFYETVLELKEPVGSPPDQISKIDFPFLGVLKIEFDENEKVNFMSGHWYDINNGIYSLARRMNNLQGITELSDAVEHGAVTFGGVIEFRRLPAPRARQWSLNSRGDSSRCREGEPYRGAGRSSLGGRATNREMVPNAGRNVVAQSEIDAIRALLSSKPRPVGWAERRARLDEVGSTWPVADDVTCEAVDCDGTPGEWSLAPGSERSRVLLYFHGGGYCSGSIISHRRLVTEAGRTARMRTLAIDYRRAPEHPFPAAHEDAMAAWRFLRRQGIAASDIAVGGDSAGGNLTLGLIQRLRAAGEPLPGCAWLLSPWTDLTMSGATLASKDTVDPLIHEAYLEELAEAYAPRGIDRKDPLISPLFADLVGFPPVLIQVGSAETLLDDATRLATAAGAADVRVTLEIWPQMIHAWPVWNAGLEDGRRALASAAQFIRTQFA
jgi:monoterpene epsilon-lactone hydrolase